MSRFPIEFIHHDIHDFAFAGQLVLFADDFQKRDGVLEIEVAEIEALGGCFGAHAEILEEAFAVAVLRGFLQFQKFIKEAEDDAEFIEISIINPCEIAH